MDKRISGSETRQCRAVFPCHLNANDSLFGGEALKWMDEVAYITASKYAGKKMYTVYIDKIRFYKPVKKDFIANITGTVVRAGAVKLTIGVEIISENLFTGEKERAASAEFTFAALDGKDRPMLLKEDYEINNFSPVREINNNLKTNQI